MCSDLKPTTREEHGQIGAGPEECHEDDKRAGVPFLWTESERAEVIQHWEKSKPKSKSKIFKRR